MRSAYSGIVVCLLGLLCAPTIAAGSSPADERLLGACVSGDSVAAGAALAEGANVNALGPNGMTALMTAALFTRPAVVSLLIERGADVNAAAEDPAIGNAFTASFFAMNGTQLLGTADEQDPEKRRDAVEVVRLLAARKPDLNLLVRRGPTNLSALMMASEAGAADVVRILLDGGADPNVANAGGYTALDFAVDRAPAGSVFPAADRVAIVRALLEKKARFDRAGADGLRPLARARKAGQAAIADLLVKAGAR